MADNKEFKDALWNAIEDVFYEFNGKKGTRFGLEDVQEVLKDHNGFFDVDDDFEDDDFEDDDFKDEDDDIYYDPTDGYEAPKGWHNSVEEAEDDYYEHSYKPNLHDEED